MGKRYKKHANTLWAARKVGEYPNIYIGVLPDGRIQITGYQAKQSIGIRQNLSRRIARLLARRINEALEAG